MGDWTLSFAFMEVTFRVLICGSQQNAYFQHQRWLSSLTTVYTLSANALNIRPLPGPMNDGQRLMGSSGHSGPARVYGHHE
ncbi:unnamed protein product [Hydatigera taeniaeformis]|uniref:Secreted protein n=1 Tax=Hydatigena taeniaeformis TaxID=6205 RepID=A0A0R3XA89_HYDTA|nr:unnamed protein product [Hydatigera taeniaeformis]